MSDPTNAEARRLAEFGMFGVDFRETKRIVNALLKRHGLKLKTHGNYAKWGDQTEVWIETIEEKFRLARIAEKRRALEGEVVKVEQQLSPKEQEVHDFWHDTRKA